MIADGFAESFLAPLRELTVLPSWTCHTFEFFIFICYYLRNVGELTEE